MDIFIRFFRWMVSMLFTLIAPVIIIILGALIAGFGLQKEWSWVVYGGGIIAIIGAILFIRIWMDWE